MPYDEGGWHLRIALGNGPGEPREPFDRGRVSDFDIALAGDGLLQKAKSLGIPLRSVGSRTRPLTAGDLQRLGLSGLAAQLSSRAGRPVNFMIYQSATDATLRTPSIQVP